MTRMPRWLPLRPVFLLALLLLLSLLLTACVQRETADPPRTPGTATAPVNTPAAVSPTTAVATTAGPTATRVPPTASALPPTSTSVPPTATVPTATVPTATVPTETAVPAGDVLAAERTMGAWTVRTYQPGPGTGMYNYLILYSEGQPEVRVDNVARTLEPPVPDVSGDGHPDLWIETRSGGSRCCWGTVVFSLAPELERVLEIDMLPDYYGTGTGGFQDLDGDGAYEFLTSDPVAGVPCSGPTVMVVLRYEQGRGYVGAGPRYPEAFASAIEAHTRRAETQIELTRDGYKCDVYEVIADYLYSGRPEGARQELERLYLGPDRDAFWDDLTAAIAGARFYVAQ